MKLSRRRHQRLSSTVVVAAGVVPAKMEPIVVEEEALVAEEVEAEVNRITDQQMLADAAAVVEQPVAMADYLTDRLSWPVRLVA